MTSSINGPNSAAVPITCMLLQGASLSYCALHLIKHHTSSPISKRMALLTACSLLRALD